jgi:hypothetical protein
MIKFIIVFRVKALCWPVSEIGRERTSGQDLRGIDAAHAGVQSTCFRLCRNLVRAVTPGNQCTSVAGTDVLS